MIYTTNYQAPIGTLTLASDGHRLTGLWLENQKYYGRNLSKDALEKNNLPLFKMVSKWLDQYFNNEKPSLSKLPLEPNGTPFQKEVWNVLCQVPPGDTISYKEIAKKIAIIMNKDSMSSIAVGNAVGKNPISIIIPCHRAVGSNGSLAGYAGGLNIKKKLLELEGVDTSKFFIPKK